MTYWQVLIAESTETAAYCGLEFEEALPPFELPRERDAEAK